MERTFDKSVLVGVGLVVALLVVNVGLAYRNTRQLLEDAGWVAHTHEVLDLTSDVLRTLVDAETGQRGFLITGRENFLEPYQQALARLDQQVTTLKEKTQDNPRQQALIHRDLKPSNVMLGEFGEVLVMDWGIAKALAARPQPAPPPPVPLSPALG